MNYIANNWVSIEMGWSGVGDGWQYFLAFFFILPPSAAACWMVPCTATQLGMASRDLSYIVSLPMYVLHRTRRGCCNLPPVKDHSGRWMHFFTACLRKTETSWMSVSLAIAVYQYVIGASMQARHDTTRHSSFKLWQTISSNYCTVSAMRGKHAGPNGDKNAERVGTCQGSPIRRASRYR